MHPMNGDRLADFAARIPGSAAVEIEIDGKWIPLDPSRIRSHIPAIILVASDQAEDRPLTHYNLTTGDLCRS